MKNFIKTNKFSQLLLNIGAVPAGKRAISSILGAWEADRASNNTQVKAEAILNAWRRSCVSIFGIAGVLAGQVFSLASVGLAGLVLAWMLTIPFQLTYFNF